MATYTVKKGDTLSQIALTYLGSASKYKYLAQINGIANPNLIYVGQVIKLDTSGGGGGSTTPSTTTSNTVTIKQFGLQADTDRTVFVTWSWNKSYTDHYIARWYYYTKDGTAFIASESNVSADTYLQSVYTAPENAVRVRVHVKPVSKTKTVNNVETSYWTGAWSNAKDYYFSNNPPKTPPIPTVNIEDYKLTADLDNLDVNASSIEFQIVRDNEIIYNTGLATIKTDSASYSCTITAGSEYKVRCRSKEGNLYSDWSDYSSNYGTMPAAPQSITVCRAKSETSVYLEWTASETATTYDIEYTTKKEYFDGSDGTTTVTGIKFTKYEKTGLESGEEYFFRVRAVNTHGNSTWSEIKSTTVGKKPAAPTTWSSTTTAITGDPLILYWVHNSQDGSSQTYADLELYINGVRETHTIKNTIDEDLKDKTSSYTLDTSSYTEGTKIQWRVRTAGVTNQYGDWSVQRTIDVYAPATLELAMIDKDSQNITTLTQFPFYISGLPGPNTQAPTGYHLIITANDMYETVDDIGRKKLVNIDDQVYSKYFDISTALLVEFSADNIDLENNIEYTVTCIVSMNSGLTAESSLTFTVGWTDDIQIPDAEIGYDEKTYTTYIRPYCESVEMTYYKVVYNAEDDTYTLTDEVLTEITGMLFENKYTTTGEKVLSGFTTDGTDIYYCAIQSKEGTLVEGVELAVYRREYDGSFSMIAKKINNIKNTYVTDPHPSLDYARYRIIATTVSTGAVAYCDIPSFPIGEKAVIIQWDEDWSTFNVTSDDVLVNPPWSGSLLRLPYNIDVSDSNKIDVSLIEYIGRKNPVAYYGTQTGETSTWNVEIEKSDKETLYGLRRLAKWMGDVYVREPSGTGYWANISVSFSQKHRELTIPVTLEITRVEGGA